MSERIVITVEQDEALTLYKANKNTLDDYLVARSHFMNEFKTLRDFAIDEFAKLLYEPNSYEVEKPKFKLDDKVVPKFDPSNEVGTVTGVTECGKGLSVSFRTHIASTASVNFRHATKEEIIFSELGREVGEFVEGDVGIDDENTKWGMPDNLNEVYRKGHLKGFYPASSFIKFP